MITTRAFWLGALERAVKTFCQTFLAVALLSLGGLTVGIDAGVQAVEWANVLSVSALATFLSLVTSVGNARFTAGDVVTPAATSGPVIVNQPQGDPAVQVGDATPDYSPAQVDPIPYASDHKLAATGYVPREDDGAQR